MEQSKGQELDEGGRRLRTPAGTRSVATSRTRLPQRACGGGAKRRANGRTRRSASHLCTNGRESRRQQRPMEGRDGGGTDLPAASRPMGGRNRKSWRPWSPRLGRGTRKTVGAGSRAVNLSNPLWNEVGHAPPRATAPPPREARPGCFLFLPALGAGRGGGRDTCLPRPVGCTPPRRGRLLVLSLLRGGRPHDRPPPGRQVHRGCADENTPSLAAPLTAGDSPHSGCPLAARLRGPVPAARVCGSRPAAHYLARKESRTAEESVLTEGVEPASLPVTCSHRGGDPASLLVAGGLGDTTLWVSV